MEENEDEKIYRNFIKTFKIKEVSLTEEQVKEAEQEVMLAEDVVNYILRQLNTASMRGVLYYNDFRLLTMRAMIGLFKLIYITHFSPNLVKQDVYFASASNFMFMLFTRVYEGKDYHALLKEIEARRPVQITTR